MRIKGKIAVSVTTILVATSGGTIAHAEHLSGSYLFRSNSLSTEEYEATQNSSTTRFSPSSDIS